MGKKMQLKNYVTQSNAVSRGAHNLSLPEKRVMALAISQINTDRRKSHYLLAEERTFTITAEQYAKLAGIDANSAYDVLTQMTDKILTKQVVYEDWYQKTNLTTGKQSKPRKKIIKHQWLEGAVYKEEEGTIAITLSSFLIPQFVELKQRFNSYQLKEIATLKSTYSIRLHEVLNSWYDVKDESLQTITFQVDKLADSLGCPADMDWRKMRERVINLAMKELQSIGYWQFGELETHRKGRKVDSVTFHVIKNNKTPDEVLAEAQADEQTK